MQKEIYESQVFRKLLDEKKRFLVPATVLFFSFYLLLPVLVLYFPAFMNRPLIAEFTVGWGLAFAQFLMVWGLGALYFYKAKQFDHKTRRISQLNQQRPGQ